MGTVHAKMPEAPEADIEKSQTKEILLANIPAKVERVSIDGLGRTKNDFISKQVAEIFDSSNFEEMVFKAQGVKNRLEQLGMFKSIRVKIDVSEGGQADPNGYEITYQVKEHRRVTGGISTLVGTNEGSVLFTMAMPNFAGRAEAVSLEYAHGTKKNSRLAMQFTKPLDGNPKVRFTTSLYQNAAEYPWSGYTETSRGTSTDITFPSLLGRHNIKYEASWRELGCMTRSTAFAVREQAGHSFKSSVKHTFMRDERDNHILPSEGSLIRVTQEIAGLGGDTHFHKHDIEFQVNKTLFWDTVLQLTLAGGMVKPINPDKPVSILDLFFIGGPLTLRGFNLKGCGPNEDGSSLGGNTYWMGGVHLYTPLPFRPGKGGFGDLFRTHFFLNTGNLTNMDLTNDPKANWEKLTSSLRISYGLGIVFKLAAVARLELNYCVPLKTQRGDSLCPGLQFGVGISFL